MGVVLEYYKTKFSADDCWRYAIAFMLMFAVMLDSSGAMAGGDAGAFLGQGLCEAIGMVTGPVGKAIATAAIITIAIGALLGRVSWGMAVMIAAGIAAIFGAGKIAAVISQQGDAQFCG